MTTVSKIRKLLASGRPRKHDQQISTVTAYGISGGLLENVRGHMELANLNPADATGLLIIDNAGKFVTVSLRPDQMNTVVPQIMLLPKEATPVGVLFAILDREETDPLKIYKTWSTCFLGGEAAMSALQNVLANERLKGQESDLLSSLYALRDGISLPVNP